MYGYNDGMYYLSDMTHLEKSQIFMFEVTVEQVMICQILA